MVRNYLAELERRVLVFDGSMGASLQTLDLSAEDRRRLNGGVEQILSKSAYAPAELMKRVGALLAEVKRKTS